MQKKTQKKIKKIREIKKEVKITEISPETKEEKSELEREVEESVESLQEKGAGIIGHTAPILPAENIRPQTSPAESPLIEDKKEAKSVSYFTAPDEEEKEKKYFTTMESTPSLTIAHPEEQRTALKQINSPSELESFTEHSLRPPIRASQEHSYPSLKEEKKYEHRIPKEEKKTDMR